MKLFMYFHFKTKRGKRDFAKSQILTNESWNVILFGLESPFSGMDTLGFGHDVQRPGRCPTTDSRE